MKSVRFLVCVGVIALAFTQPTLAQQSTSGGTITGIVRDGASRPVADADVIAHPGGRRTRSDSSGRFMFTGLDPDNYTVRARKVGFLPESWDVKLTKSSKIDIAIVLDRQLPVLDTVKIRASRDCPQLSIEAFVCRRGRAGGLFFDYMDIDDKEVTYVGEFMRDVPGFRVDFRIDKNGPTYIIKTAKLSGCVTTLVDGKPISAANYMPELVSTLIAIEVYPNSESVPEELTRFAWPKGELGRTGKCIVVVYWTNRPARTVIHSPMRAAP